MRLLVNVSVRLCTVIPAHLIEFDDIRLQLLLWNPVREVHQMLRIMIRLSTPLGIKANLSLVRIAESTQCIDFHDPIRGVVLARIEVEIVSRGGYGDIGLLQQIFEGLRADVLELAGDLLLASGSAGALLVAKEDVFALGIGEECPHSSAPCSLQVQRCVDVEGDGGKDAHGRVKGGCKVHILRNNAAKDLPLRCLNETRTILSDFLGAIGNVQCSADCYV